MSGITAPFDRRALENEIAAWIFRAVGITFIWENQNGKNPEYPYATGKISGPTSYGMDETRVDGDPADPQPGAEVEIASVGLRKISVSINVYARANGDPEIEDAGQHLDKARAALTLQSYIDEFQAAGMAFIDDAGMQNLDFLNSDKFLSRRQMDFRFCIASNATERVGYIETAQVTAPDLGWNPETFTLIPPEGGL